MIQSERVTKSIKDKRALNYLFIGAMVFLELLVLGALIFIIIKTTFLCVIIKDRSISINPATAKEFYNMLALGLIVIWFGILLGFYAWAIYFYNINLGLTNEDWSEIRDQKANSPECTDEIRTKNPNGEHTLGLPPGTLRATIALTLLIGGLAMAIASLGMDTTVKANSFVVDNFDFFKTAFIMMIAFYFGNKALESIGYRSQSARDRSQNQEAQSSIPGVATSAANYGATTDAPASNVRGAASEAKKILKSEEAIISSDPNTEKSEDLNDFENPQAVQ